MDSFKMPEVPAGKVITGTILALFVGMLFPVILTMQFTLVMPMILLTNLLIPVFYVNNGKIPVGALVISEMAASMFFFGETITLMIITASVFPGLIVVSGISRRTKFFDQMRTGIIVHAIGYITAVAIAYMSFGGDMIQKLIDGLRAQVDLMPDELIQPMVEYVNQMTAAMVGGEVPEQFIATVDTYRDMVGNTALGLLQEMYVEYLPGNIMVGAVITGMLSVLWGNWRMARKGLATTESFVGMSGWRLPVQVCGGVYFIWIIGAFLTNVKNFSSSMVAYRTIYMLVQVAFYIQALSGFDRMLIARYTGLRARRIIMFAVLIAAMIIPLVNLILFISGGGTTLVTVIRHFAEIIKKKIDEDDDNNNMF